MTRRAFFYSQTCEGAKTIDTASVAWPWISIKPLETIWILTERIPIPKKVNSGHWNSSESHFIFAIHHEGVMTTLPIFCYKSLVIHKVRGLGRIALTSVIRGFNPVCFLCVAWWKSYIMYIMYHTYRYRIKDCVPVCCVNVMSAALKELSANNLTSWPSDHLLKVFQHDIGDLIATEVSNKGLPGPSYVNRLP